MSSWQIAMSEDVDLLNLSKQINNLTPNQFNQIDDLFSEFLFKWAGVENTTNAQMYNGTNTGFDPRKMAFLEKITGLDFNYTTQNAIPLAVTAWNSFYNSLLNRFLIQGTFKEIFPNAHYDFTTDTLTINNNLDEVITNILSLSDQMDESSFLNYAYYAQNILQLNRDQFSDVNFDTKVKTAITNIINSASIEGFQFNGAFNIGDVGNNSLFGGVNNDVLKGLEGNDVIFGDGGNDYIEGGKGNDQLKGGAGNDIYKFNLGDGIDVIEDGAGTDKIIFGEGVSLANITFARVGNDLVISIGSNGDQIGIKNFYSATVNRVENIIFIDGSQFSLANLGNIIVGTDSDDKDESIDGGSGDDIIDVRGGNDVVDSRHGNDTVTGGKGNDILVDGSGNETYIFNIGDGSDTISNYTGTDKIIFGNGILQSDITLIPNNQDLIIKIGSNGDQIYINNFFGSGLYVIETLQFADGSIMNLSLGLTLNGTNTSGETINATSFNDVINGNVGNDTINAGNGNDIINGGNGNDTISLGLGNDVVTGGKGNDNLNDYSGGDDAYIFNIGDGQDVIYDFLGSDKIILGSGIFQSDITLIPNNQNLVTKIRNNGDQITINNFFESTTQYKIETLQFADGSTMDLSSGLTLNGTNPSGETINATSFNDIINGNVGNDTINAGNGNDIINGGDGNDTISAGNGNDIITGGKGNDVINNNFSDNGNDTYIFNIGDGADTITDFTGLDKIIFGNGINQGNVFIEANGSNLIVRVGSSGDKITIINFFINGNNKIETLQFADGSVFNISDGINVSGSASNDNIIGTPFSDVLSGGDGNDYLYGSDGDDVLQGGNGSDNLRGGRNNDIYKFGAEFINQNNNDNDRIYDEEGIDTILFANGISPNLIFMARNGNDLIISGQNTSNIITLSGFFSLSSNRVGFLEFNDGSRLKLMILP